MNLIENILQNWSVYERNMEIFLMVGILGVSILSIYLTTKNRKLLLLSSISLISVLLLNFLGILLISGVFKLNISEIFRLIPILSLLLTISNLGILVGFYISKREIKGFKISSIRKEYFTDSVKQSVFFVLLGISTLLFLSPQTVAVVSISLLSTVLTIWLTYWISKYILK